MPENRGGNRLRIVQAGSEVDFGENERSRINLKIMRDYYHIKVNLPGGIASPGHLKQVLSAAWAAHVRKVRFGSRQQMLMTVHYEDMRFLEAD